MPEDPTPGRRERKRAATRQAIAEGALKLFLERGFDGVSVNEIAEKADVATATLFNYFASKEAILFDRDDDIDNQLAQALRERPPGVTVFDALRDHALTTWVPLTRDPQHAPRRRLIADTPALRAHSERLWLQHTGALAAVIATELGHPEDDLESLVLARCVLEVTLLTADREDVEAAVQTVFDVLARGFATE